MLHYVAVVLQYVAVSYSMLQCVTVCCSVLQFPLALTQHSQKGGGGGVRSVQLIRNYSAIR